MLVIVWSHVWSWNETQVTGKPTCSAREEAKSRGPPDAMLLLMVYQNCPFVSLVFFRGTLCLLVHNPYELQRYVIYIYTYLPQILVCQNWGISLTQIEKLFGAHRSWNLLKAMQYLQQQGLWVPRGWLIPLASAVSLTRNKHHNSVIHGSHTI